MRASGLPLLPILTLIITFAAPALGDPRAPVTVVPAPEDQGDIFSPGVRLVADLEQNYVEEEFLVSGAATLFTYEEEPQRGVIVPLQEDVPYTTRIIVRRPVKANKFNGTLVIEWWNSTADFDVAPVWDPSAEYFAREGIVYVGVTNSTTSLGFLVGGCRLFGLLPPTCGTRYAGLSSTDKRRTAEDAKLFRFIRDVKKRLPREPQTVYLLTKDPEASDRYLQLRARYHLLPHNVCTYYSHPPRDVLHEDAYFLVFNPRPDLRYDESSHTLRSTARAGVTVDGGEETAVLTVERLLVLQLGALYHRF